VVILGMDSKRQMKAIKTFKVTPMGKPDRDNYIKRIFLLDSLVYYLAPKMIGCNTKN